MLKEQIVEPICEACLPLICAHWDLPPKERLEKCKPLRNWTDHIINLFKAEVDKLTELTDEEWFVDYEVEYAKKYALCFPLAGEHRDTCNREAQLQHTKKQLLDLMGE